MYELDNGAIYIEKEDQCSRCLHGFDSDNFCPLLEALGVGLVYLDGDVEVRNCGFYKERLRVV